MSVDIAPGSGNIGLTSSTYPSWGFLTTTDNETVTAADPSNPRHDIVVAYRDMSVISSSSNNNPGALKFKVVAGLPAGSPTDPTSGTIQAAVGSVNPWIPLGRITLPANAGSVVNAYITDIRQPIGWMGNLWGGSSNTNGHVIPNVADDTVLLANAAATVKNKTFDNTNTIITNGWQADKNTYTYNANNGNREFVLTPTSDPTSYLQAGTKVSYTRGTVPSTQSMSFTAASSQYASNASPTGISFTGAFTCEAWVKLLSYPGASQSVGVISRSDNSTGGFYLSISQTGQLVGVYGSSSTFTTSTTFQSIPLNQYVHVVFVVSSVSSKTVAFYINGMSVPFNQVGSATALTQTGSLEIGAVATVANSFLNGNIYQPRIWSVARSQANIQANMGVALTTGTNLVFVTADGSFNDASGVGNNLTAQNGASASATGNPFNAIEYGFVTVAASGSIIVKAVTNVIPNMTLLSPQYSYEASPFGWTSVSSALLGHRLLELPFLTNQTTTSNSAAPFGGSSSSTFWPFTVPANCSKIRVSAFNTSVAASGNTVVFFIQNGSSLIAQINHNPSNMHFSPQVLIPVVPGSTFDFNITWDTTAGTAQWSNISGIGEQGFSVEAA